MKSGFYTATSDDQLTKKFHNTSQSQICTKKRCGHCLVICCQFVPRHLSESQQNHYICEVSSTHWWDAMKTAILAPNISQQKGPNSFPWQYPTAHHTTNASEIKRVELWSFAFICYILLTSHQLITTSSSISATSCRETLPQPVGNRKCFPRVCCIPKHRFLCYRHKQTYFSSAKMHWL